MPCPSCPQSLWINPSNTTIVMESVSKVSGIFRSLSTVFKLFKTCKPVSNYHESIFGDRVDWCCAKKAATTTNTHPHMKWAKGSQDHFRAQEGGHTSQHQPLHGGSQREPRPLQSPRRRPDQPPPTFTWRESRRVKTTSEPKKAATSTNTKATRSKVALRTPTVNRLGKNQQKSKTKLIPNPSDVYQFNYLFKAHIVEHAF